MLNKLNVNELPLTVIAIFFVIAFAGCRAKQELPKFVPDDNAVDLPESIAPDQRPPH
jgi:hypothetical protein